MQFLNTAYDVLKDILKTIGLKILDNLKNIANILNIILPYTCIYFTQEGQINLIGKILFPILILACIYYLKALANRTGKGTKIPRPINRFTDVSNDGEVTIPKDRLEELILYMADLEDWLERNHIN